MQPPQLFTAAILFSLSMTSYAAPLDCQSFTTTTVPNNGDVFTNDADCNIDLGSVINQGQLTNNASITMFGVPNGIQNSGTYNNNGSTAIYNGSVQNTLSGTINNKGSIAVTDASGIYNEGLFRNDGYVSAAISGSDVWNSGTWINSAGSEIELFHGIITNSGDFIVEQGASIKASDAPQGSFFTQSAGTTFLDGAYSGAGMEISGGKLVGSGSFAHGTRSGEFDPAGLTVQNATFEVGSNGAGQFDVDGKFACLTCTMLFDIAKPGTGASDFLNITANRPWNGTAIFDDTVFEFSLLDGYYGSTGDIIDLAFAEGGFDLGTVNTNLGMIVSTGNTLSLRVPEPSSLALLGLGLLGLLRRFRPLAFPHLSSGH